MFRLCRRPNVARQVDARDRCQATRPKVLAAGSIRGAVIAGLLLHGRGDVPGADVSALTLGGGSDRRAGPGGSRKAAASDRALADEVVAGGLPVAGENPPGRPFPGWARLAGSPARRAWKHAGGHRRRGARRPPALVVGPRRRSVGLGPPSSASAGRVGARESVTVAVGFEPRIAVIVNPNLEVVELGVQLLVRRHPGKKGIAPDRCRHRAGPADAIVECRCARRPNTTPTTWRSLSGVPVPPGCGGRPGWSATGDVVSGARRRAGRTTQPRRPARGAGGGSRFEGSSGAGQTRRPPLDRRNSPARPRPIHVVSAAPSAPRQALQRWRPRGPGRHTSSPPSPWSAGAGGGLQWTPYQRAARSDAFTRGLGDHRRRCPKPSGVDCAGLRLVAERSLG